MSKRFVLKIKKRRDGMRNVWGVWDKDKQRFVVTDKGQFDFDWIRAERDLLNQDLNRVKNYERK